MHVCYFFKITNYLHYITTRSVINKRVFVIDPTAIQRSVFPFRELYTSYVRISNGRQRTERKTRWISWIDHIGTNYSAFAMLSNMNLDLINCTLIHHRNLSIIANILQFHQLCFKKAVFPKITFPHCDILSSYCTLVHYQKIFVFSTSLAFVSPKCHEIMMEMIKKWIKSKY
jgi:hypothetical protein